ncbi:MAG: hypothetical protein PVSMB11_11530 [Desulfuromonadaceae bacterium]
MDMGIFIQTMRLVWQPNASNAKEVVGNLCVGLPYELTFRKKLRGGSHHVI